MNYRTNQPFVGHSAFAHKGGMHVHAVARVTNSYEHIEPEKVGNERRILLSELSGRSNIVALTTRHNLQDDKEMMDRILAQVVKLENQGYQFEAAEASFDLLVRRAAGKFKPHFETLKYHVSVESDEPGPLHTEATVKIRVGETQRHEVAEGDGPVNALDAALRKALNGSFPNLNEMHLVDYKVRVINSEAGTAAGVRVTIESRDDKDVWGTVGVSENIIEASWMALVDAVEYKLCKDEQVGCCTNAVQVTAPLYSAHGSPAGRFPSLAAIMTGSKTTNFPHSIFHEQPQSYFSHRRRTSQAVRSYRRARAVVQILGRARLFQQRSGSGK